MSAKTQSNNMKKRSLLLACFAFISVGLAFSATPSFAQKKTIKTCREEWRANKAANEAAKITERDYVAKCRTEAAKQATGTTATPTPPAAAPTPSPATANKPTGGRQAAYARQRACGADWKADKAAGKVPAGMTWPKYWSECNKRKKAAGM